MASQTVRMQVEKNFTQNPGETDAQSVTQSERANLALLFQRTVLVGLLRGPIRKRRANAETLPRSQYSLALGKLISPFHLLYSIVCPGLLPRQDSATVECEEIALRVAGTKHCSDGRHS